MLTSLSCLMKVVKPPVDTLEEEGEGLNSDSFPCARDHFVDHHRTIVEEPIHKSCNPLSITLPYIAFSTSPHLLIPMLSIFTIRIGIRPKERITAMLHKMKSWLSEIIHIFKYMWIREVYYNPSLLISRSILCVFS